MPEGEEEEQEIENLFEQLMKEYFPNLAKKIRLPGSPGSPGSAASPKEVGPKEEHTPRHIIITLPKIKDKKRSLKTARGDSYLQRSSHKTVSWFF